MSIVINPMSLLLSTLPRSFMVSIWTFTELLINFRIKTCVMSFFINSISFLLWSKRMFFCVFQGLLDALEVFLLEKQIPHEI